MHGRTLVSGVQTVAPMKKTNAKLTLKLKTNTVRVLQDDALRRIAGGGFTQDLAMCTASALTCYSCGPYNC